MQNIIEYATQQVEKENYIADMMIRTLFSNDVDISECNHIIDIVKEKVCGNTYPTINSKHNG